MPFIGWLQRLTTTLKGMVSRLTLICGCRANLLRILIATDNHLVR